MQQKRSKTSTKGVRLLQCVIGMMIMILMCVLSACGNKPQEKETDGNSLHIVTTLFPYYDFARAVVKDVDGISLSMTVAPGQDSHSFEPTPKDVIAIEEADLFIYNGGSIESWVDAVLETQDTSEQVRIRMMDYVDVLEEQTVEGMDLRYEREHQHEGKHSDEHSQEGVFEKDNDGTESHTHHEGEHEPEYDEHIWTSPVNAALMVSYICEEISTIDPKHREQYEKNANEYIEKLQQIDAKIRQTVDEMPVKEMIFADKFPLLYFAKEYGISYYAAFPGCANDSEPSVKTITFLIDKMKEDGINKVYYLELSSKAVANTICEDTGAKAYEFQTCHNITQKQFEAGVTYVDLMKKNLAALRK